MCASQGSIRRPRRAGRRKATLPDVSAAENDGATTRDDETAARLKEATELLESIAQDRSLLGALTVEERTRLLTAAADVFNPDVVQRRRFTKAKRKLERDARYAARKERKKKKKSASERYG